MSGLLCTGLFVFWDRYHYDDVSVPINEAKRQRALDGFHQLHPLTFTRSFFERHLSTSYVTLLMENTANLQMTTFVGRKANHTTVSAHRSDRAKPQVLVAQIADVTPLSALKDKPQASAYPTDESALQLIPVSGGHPKFEHCVLQDTPIEALSAQDSNDAGCGPNGKVYLHALHFGRGRANVECVADVDFDLFVSCWLAWRHMRPKGIWHYISVSSYSLLFACRRTLRRPD